MIQRRLIDLPPDWQDHWVGMPSYDHQDLEPFRSLIVHFQSQHDVEQFAETIKRSIGPKERSLWFPDVGIGRYADKCYKTDRSVTPRYPIYVISKGRWESRLTSKALERINTPYRIVVEPTEREEYAKVIDPAKILVLPFADLGQGSIPARNWVWDHAIREGVERYWILDDNIAGFYRFQDNLKCPVGDSVIFRAAEDFVDRYENVGLAGFQYFMFVTRKAGNIPPYYLNTRIYSCILVKTDLAHRWRGRYNEDTDLSLRVLSDGWCTVLFNAFLCDKAPTMTMKGGNTDELYAGNGRLQMAESLREQHPTLVYVTEKWGRAQHHVNYKPFRRNRLRRKADAEIGSTREDDYGMKLLQSQSNEGPG